MHQTPVCPLRVEQQGPIARLTLDRPEALNSLDGDLVSRLCDALDDLAGNASVRCIVLQGAGRAFCAGQDLKDPAVMPEGGGVADLGDVVARRYKPLMLRLRGMPVPTVAAVGGVAAGAGASLALMCDFVIARRSASFIQAFSAIGLIPDSGATWLLPRLVGRSRAIGLAMLGEKLSAERAEGMGLIWKCVDDAALDTEVLALAERLCKLPLQALATTRSLLDAGLESSLTEALDAEAQAQRKLGFAHDYAEGVAAFVQKRAPLFTDR